MSLMTNDKTELISIKQVNGVNSVFFRDKNFYSSYRPKEAAEKIASNILLQENVLYVIESPLLDYGVDIIENRLPSSSFILKIEVDENLYKLSKNDVYLYKTEQLFFEYLKNKFDFKIIKKIEFISLNGAKEVLKDNYKKIENSINYYFDNFLKNRLTQIFFKDLWIKNIFKNLKIASKINLIDKIKTDKEVLVCGAGLTLENSIDYIKNNRENFTIIAVDTAVGVLLKNNIKIDIIVVLEAQVANIKDFIYKIPKDSIFICDLSSYSNLNSYFKNIMFVTTIFADISIFKRLKKAFNFLTIPESGSVGLAAIYIAQYLTTKSIYYIGLDFCYVQTKSHSRGTYSHDQILNNSTRLNSCLKLSSNIVKLNDNFITNKAMQNYKNNFNHIINQNNKIKLLNLNEKKECNNSEIYYTTKTFNTEIKQFFKAELEYLNNFNNDTINTIDYCYYFFPDQNKDNESFQKRVNLYVLKYKNLLEKLILI